MKNLIQRAITGLLFVAVLVGCILYGSLSFALLFALITALSVWEFAQVVNRQEGITINPLLVTASAVCLFVAFHLHSCMAADARIFAPYLLLLLYLLVSQLYLKRPNPIHNWAYSFMSQCYVALPFALLNVLAFQGHTEADGSYTLAYNPILPLSVFLFNWSNDTGAYCTGMLFGKHRLFERISPKKSWEGSVGGAVISVVLALVLARYFTELTTLQWVGFALVVVVFGTWGDLVESLFKRTLGIKDSGNILPGHGGMLDRFDSTLLAVPAVLLYLYTLSL